MAESPLISRGDFMRTLACAGLAALIAPPTRSHAAAVKAGAHNDVDRFYDLKKSCGVKFTLDYERDEGSELERVAAWAKSNALISDVYGSGGFAQSFERKVADMLGKEDACWFITGTMAQLSALRLYAEESGRTAIGWHPSSHHLLHEKDAYREMHGLTSEVLCPWDRPLLAPDIAAAPDLAAVSAELPVRWIGQLQSWDELQALKNAAKQRSFPLIMDGARLWEAQPHFDRPYADICDGFDSVYVSFYKSVQGLGGAMIAGRRAFIDKIRIWRHRHGGNVYQGLPHMASAAMRLDETLANVPRYHARARSFSAALAKNTDLIVMPTPAQTLLFRVFVPGTPEEMTQRRDKIAKQHSIWVADSFKPSRVPGLVQAELQIGAPFDGISESDAAAAFNMLLEG